LHHNKAHTLQFSVKFKTGHRILHTLLHPERQTQHISLRHQDELWHIYFKSVISVCQLALFQYAGISCGPNPQNQTTWRQRETQLAIMFVYHTQSIDQ